MIEYCVVSTAKVQKIWEQFTTCLIDGDDLLGLFRLQKYKKFESNSQLMLEKCGLALCCFDCKSTKNLRAIHNCAKPVIGKSRLFRLQKYKKFESNSQRYWLINERGNSCFDCKSTKNLRAIHNDSAQGLISSALFRLQKYKKFESNSQPPQMMMTSSYGCFDCKSTKNLRAIHNLIWFILMIEKLFRLQKYKKFESNSQRHTRI